MRYHVDVWSDTEVSGWAHDSAYPDAHVPIEVRFRDRVLGHVIAETPRGDLAALRPDGACAFRIPLNSFAIGVRQQLNLRLPNGQILTRPATSPDVNNLQSGHSAFGSLWIDRPDWIETLRQKQTEGLSEEVAIRIFQFVRDGFVVIPQAVAPEVVAKVNAAVEAAWASTDSGLFMETFTKDVKGVQIIPVDQKHRYGPTKLLDTYARLEAARAASSAPAVVEFLTAIFEEPPRAFQQLHFTRGSQQPVHKDTAYVKIDSNPMAIAATWLALEDISEGTGELEYYVGSHHAPDFKFGGINKWISQKPDDHDEFLQSLHRDAETYRQRKHSFLGKAGDVLIWHADLAHGGSRVAHPEKTRKSLVTHYTGVNEDPHYLRTVNFQSLSHDGVMFSSNYSDVI
ncbi:phytanoyl-CoA dioxygenase family protein [Sphingobium rhizovicinum]|uniref:Phytanoyl-CoA dioxygenase family protein n=1 Tax=Sphingobium rhizovicinum TaxID=432308 RepID=A0ABV7ND09_9SPHN